MLMSVLCDGQRGCGVSDQAFQKCSRTHSNRQLRVDSPQCREGWRLLTGDGFQALPCWVLPELVFQLFGVVSLSHFYLPIQCVFGLFVQGFVPTNVSTLFGLGKLFEFCTEPRSVVVKF